jgi:hypothetical protein
MRRSVLSLITALVCTIVFAQKGDDHWEVYIAQYEKGPGSTLVNMSIKSEAPHKNYRYLISTGVRFVDCIQDGFPSKQEFEKLYALSDSVKKVFASLQHIMAGTFTYQCERKDYYYTNDTSGVREKLFALYKNRFPGYQPIINIREDATWEAYLTFLYPNEETMEFIQNTKVVLKLSEAGDKLDKERLVDHWLYFPNAKSRESFIAFAKTKGFNVESKEMRDGLRPFQLRINKVHKVDLPFISEVTLALRREAVKYGGEYDGWETHVVK